MTPLLPPIAGTMLGRFRIRKGAWSDVSDCDRIARQFPDELGWVRKDSLRDSANAGTLHVGEVDGVIRGFVEFGSPSRGENKGWNVVYHLVTERGWDGYGIGRNMLYSVPTPIRLKCPAVIGKRNRANPANDFYARAGFTLAQQEQTRGGRPLNVWEMRILAQLVKGGNAEIPRVARLSGWAYGVRSDDPPSDYPFALDVDFEKYHQSDESGKKVFWSDYCDKIRRWRPVQALVSDYMHPSQRDLMLSQVNDLRSLGVLRIMVCPKFPTAVADIPSDCIVAVSIPSGYAGYIPPLETMRGRSVHFLGGSAVKWFNDPNYLSMFEGAGIRVASVDGSWHTNIARFGGWWENNRRMSSHKTLKLYDLAVLSGRNIGQQLNKQQEYTQPQLALFAA